MEIDFMGLAPKKVKQEVTTDGCYDSASLRSSAMQWPFSNKTSAFPQPLSFKGAQEDRPKRSGYNSLVSEGYTGVMQKNLNLGKQVGRDYAVTTFTPLHCDSDSVHRLHDARLLPIANSTNQNIPFAISTPVHHSFVASAGQNVISSTVNPKTLGDVSIIEPPAVGTTSNSIVGNTNLRNASMTAEAPVRLTIFYDGLVCVYDDVPPEKVQAIMLLAGNVPSVTPNETQVQATIPRSSAGDGHLLNQSNSTTPCFGLSRHISVTSHSSSQPAGGTRSTNDTTAVKPIATLASPTIPEPPKVVSSLGSVPGTLIATAVPLARKASLARFFEKRKERVMSTSPYANKQPPDCSTPESVSRSFSVNSQGSSLPDVN